MCSNNECVKFWTNDGGRTWYDNPSYDGDTYDYMYWLTSARHTEEEQMKLIDDYLKNKSSIEPDMTKYFMWDEDKKNYISPYTVKLFSGSHIYMPRKPKSKKNPRNPKKIVVRDNAVRRRPQKSTIFAPIGRIAGTALGGLLGGPAAAGIGAGLGSTAGEYVSKLLGFGSYTVKRNTILDNSIPQFENRMGDGTIRIRHKEFIRDVISSSSPGNFNVITFNVSASNPTTFPYLSQLAVNFEEYAFEGLVFEYITSSGSISSTGQLGTVIGAMQFNSLAAPYVNKQQMEASTFGTSTVASQSCMFPIECDAMQTPSNGIFYNVRPGISNVNNDPRWSQLGNFSLATVGMPNASETVGELYVTYDCLLMKPILIQDSDARADHWIQPTGAGVVAGSVYFGTNPTLTAQSDNFTSLGGTVINFDPSFFGNVAISYALHGSAGLWVDPTMTAGNSSAVPLNLLDGGVTYQYVKDSLATDLEIYTTAYFTIQPLGGVGGQVALAGGTFFNPTFMDLIIVQLPSDLVQ